MKEPNDITYNIFKYADLLALKVANLPIGFCQKTTERFDGSNGVVMEEISVGNDKEQGPFISKITREIVEEGKYKGDTKATIRMVGYLPNKEGTEKEIVYAEYSALEYSPVEFEGTSFRQTGDNQFVECDKTEYTKNFNDLITIVNKATMDTEAKDITANSPAFGEFDSERLAVLNESAN